MTLLQAIILGIIQGLTEFLPISSSAHLVLTPYLLGWQIPVDQGFVFDVLVQMGTLIAVILYFWKDLWEVLAAVVKGLAQRQPFASAESRLGWYIVLATIPAGLFGLLVKDQVEAAFASPLATAGFLLITAAMLAAAERFGRRGRSQADFDWKDALTMGVFQALAIFPGVSRSGSSISGGMFRHLDRPTAARFSFLMSVPIMLAAGGLALLDLKDIPGLASYLPSVIGGFIAAGIVGYLSIHWLLGYLRRHSLYGFAIYCVSVAALVGLVALLRG